MKTFEKERGKVEGVLQTIFHTWILSFVLGMVSSMEVKSNTLYGTVCVCMCVQWVWWEDCFIKPVSLWPSIFCWTTIPHHP